MTAGQEGIIRLWDIANIGMCYKSIVANYNPHKSTSLASASYSPNAKYLLASCFNNEHRLIPIHNNHLNINDDSYRKKFYSYIGHMNEKYSIQSLLYSNPSIGNYIYSGSEDGMVLIYLYI